MRSIRFQGRDQRPTEIFQVTKYFNRVFSADDIRGQPKLSEAEM